MNSWRDKFTYKALETGADLYFNGSVTILSCTGTECSAAVSGRSQRIVTVSCSKGCSCTCKRPFCAHMAAVLFAAEYSKPHEENRAERVLCRLEQLLQNENLTAESYYDQILTPLYKEIHRTEADSLFQVINTVRERILLCHPDEASLKKISQETAAFLEELSLCAEEKNIRQRG